jgi:hypothetical protein
MRYDKIAYGLVIRLKNYNNINKPDYWTSDMAMDFAGKLFIVNKKYRWDSEPIERVRIRDIKSGKQVEYFFSVNDLIKANT